MTWQSELEKFKASRRYKSWSRHQTWSGYVWPQGATMRARFRGDTSMSGAELVAEAEWLLSFGMSPERVAEQLDRDVTAIAKAAYRAGRNDIGALFEGLRERKAA